MNFHARYSAKEREYEYIILNRVAPPVLDKNKVWYLRSKLDTSLMEKAAKRLIGTHNFNAFRSANCQANSPIRTLKKIKILNKDEKIIFILRSKSFLKNQVRSIVGCLKYIGEKKWTIKDLEKVIKIKKKKKLCSSCTCAWIVSIENYLLSLNDFSIRHREPCLTIYPQQFFELHLHG